ncbi:Chromatin assembly factor 1 subunit FAS1 [Quillaja saponaria]|uniref:Chromatin assembly factor 1 subunit FAS1 n=1 Tax=Quillaja saponaria TaxID=32244 RepID=A0AAD7QBB8_QUISA|nr:Chromatin assembly factor 1 subunit FAS1 [Quillaja saponaria]
MVDAGIIDVDGGQKMNGQNRARKTQKRKRVSFLQENLCSEEKEAQIEAFCKQLDGLFEYYKEVMTSELPLSRLVSEIFDKLNKIGNGAVLEPLTLASVKTSVLSIGQRLMYGAPNADADVLEDDSESCLWCWETRDVKLIPESVRGLISVRRICRKMIHERIIAVSAALQKSETDQNYKHDLIKASAKLGKASTEEDIRLKVNHLLAKNIANMAGKKSKREEKMLIKQLERNKRESEKEKKKMDHELQKEQLQAEKHLKLLKGVVEKDEMCSEKEVSEMRKQQRKQQEEAEKNQRRCEKEAAELKRKLSLQKQVSMMERFIKKSKASPSCEHDRLSTKAASSDSSNKKSEHVPKAVTLSMDCALASSNEINWWEYLEVNQSAQTEDIIGVYARSLELSCPSNGDSFLDFKKCNWAKQLFQFDKSHRPAFYGIWPKKSHVVGPCHPFMKDPGLDYDIDSDEEWEEEDPGESLSDCDKDEDESLEGCSKSNDDDESEDGFLVPDGYLSENEGVQVDRMEMDTKIEDDLRKRSHVFKEKIESEEFCALLRCQKYLNNLTKHALRKNQPLIISNLMHNKSSLLLAKNLSGTVKLEQMCLEALSMCGIPGGSPVEISKNNTQDNKQEAFLSCVKASAVPISHVTAIPESNLPAIVSAIQTCSLGQK